MTEAYDVVIIGAGHNGLVCAGYIAAAGRRTLVVEAGEHAGGAAVTREFAPGYKVSACAHLLHMLDPEIARELDLERHGLALAARELDTVALAEDGKHLVLTAGGIGGAGISAADLAALTKLRARLGRFAALLEKFYARRPPRLAPGDRQELFAAARLALDMRRLGQEDMRELLRVAAINIYDVLEENLEHKGLKGALALDGVLGSHLGPRSNNSVLNFLHRLTGSYAGARGTFAIPRGGMGALSAALVAAAESRGATIRLGTPVKQIRLEGDRAGGVELASGEHIAARTVISSADPKTTFFELLGAGHLEAGFAHRIQNIRMRGNAAKLHLALDALPGFEGLDPAAMRNRLLIAPSMGYIERAFDCAKYGRCSEAPVFEITVPTVSDPGLAPQGKHVLSAVVQYAPYDVRDGWDAAREPFMQAAIDYLAVYAPDLREHIVAAELLSPVDIEREFRVSGGHWHHGELAFDQFLMMRPVPGAAQYATPMPGLYLCGAGCHPGGGVMGTPGRNAAREVLAREKAA